MKKIIFSICCLISINALPQTVVEQIKERLERSQKNTSFDSYSIDILFNNRKTITEAELDSIFEIHKEYYGKAADAYEPILDGMWYVYAKTNNNMLKTSILYMAEQAINDTIIDYVQRNNISKLFINGVDLQFFDEKMKVEVVKNLNFPYKNDRKNMLNYNMILLAGALNMQDIKDRLYIIADSSSMNYGIYKEAAKIALCRMGERKMLIEFFSNLQSMQLKDVLDRWKEIEYIKQKESVDILLKILYSDETRPPVKETLPNEKLAYYAMKAIERISVNCPIKVQNINGYERDKALEQIRKWAKTNKIEINRYIW
ncbi:hypothetical protein [Viscerimonas tarda]